MAFKDFLLSFFPHRWLNPDHPNNVKFFGRLSNVLNYTEHLVTQVDKESNIRTAIFSIADKEKELGIESDSLLSLEIRRSNIIAHERKGTTPITKEQLINSLRAYGIETEIENIFNNHEMIIYLKYDTTICKETFEQVTKFVEKVCRAHVGKTWAFTYVEKINIKSSYERYRYNHVMTGQSTLCGSNPIVTQLGRINKTKILTSSNYYNCINDYILCGNGDIKRTLGRVNKANIKTKAEYRKIVSNYPLTGDSICGLYPHISTLGRVNKSNINSKIEYVFNFGDRIYESNLNIGLQIRQIVSVR